MGLGPVLLKDLVDDVFENEIVLVVKGTRSELEYLIDSELNLIPPARGTLYKRPSAQATHAWTISAPETPAYGEVA
jgi:hypothetical protein